MRNWFRLVLKSGFLNAESLCVKNILILKAAYHNQSDAQINASSMNINFFQIGLSMLRVVKDKVILCTLS